MPKNEPTQIERFRAKARALGCDDDKEKFEATLKKIAAYKPKKKTASTSRPSPSSREG
jgi:hypothetical protein